MAAPVAICKTSTTPGTYWLFCPSLPAACLYVALFGLTTLLHIYQMIQSRKWHSLVIVTSGLIQTAAYALRILSIINPAHGGYYPAHFILLMVGPVWTNAYAYMVMGRMVYNFTSNAAVYRIRAWRLGTTFVLLDVACFLIQLSGAALATADGWATTRKRMMDGLHIYMAGCGFQQLCILLFLVVTIRMHREVSTQAATEQKRRALMLLYTEYVVVFFISVRIVFRLIEFSKGLQSSIPWHEEFQYVLDSTLMLVASVLFNLLHPGRLMPGKESDLPGRKERRAQKLRGEIVIRRGDDDVETMVSKESGAKYEMTWI